MNLKIKSLGFLFLAAICLPNILKSQKIAEFEVSSGPYDRLNSIVGYDLGAIAMEPVEHLSLIEPGKNGRKEIPFQIGQSGNGRKIWWIMSGRTKAGEKKVYELVKSNAAPQNAERVKSAINDSALVIFNRNAPVLQYFHAIKNPPSGVDAIFGRSGFIHPVWSPSGTVLTNIQPRDHYHHYGIWNPWTRALIEGDTIDFWNLGERQGTVRFNGFAKIYSGNVFAGFKALHQHVVLKNNPKIALNEEVDVRVYDQSDNNEKVWLWDFTSTLTCASDFPVVLLAYRYAGFGFRATPEWTNKNSRVLTSENMDRKTADGSTGRWIFVTGETASGKSGILFMSYPANQNHPEPLRVWPENANGNRGDVFVNFSPTKNKDWVLEPGKEYVLRYRLLIYDGDIDARVAETYWQDFANPPVVTVRRF